MDFDEIKRILEDHNRKIFDSNKSKRFLSLPEGRKYPSVTTILYAVSDKSWLEEWKKRVGEETANKIMKESASRGNSLHDIIERHYNDQLTEEDKKSEGWNLYKSMLIHLNKLAPFSFEIPLWSDHLRIAGRADCVGIYEDQLCLIDFKSSKREKTSEMIQNYFLQCTLYSLMLYELLSIECKKIVVMIANEQGFPQVFKREVKDYAKEAISCVKLYYSNFHGNASAS